MSQPEKPIAFIDLKVQRDRVRDRVMARWQRVLDHGQYVMGPEVGELEDRLADFTGARSVVSCSSGTDAVWLPMLALGVGPGDAVFVPSWTFTATAEAVCLTGATPVFVDVDAGSFNMDPDSLSRTIAAVRETGALTPRAIIPVDLFGAVADYDAINAIAAAEELAVVADAAQSFGARLRNKRVGSLAAVTATSFFPAKPLGCWGDGGAIFTDDPDMAEAFRSVRIHGRGGDGKYDNVRVGTNARLDTLQAVVLLEKLTIFEDELDRRQAVADRYAANLPAAVTAPTVPADSTSAWAQYTITTDRRGHLRKFLQDRGIPTQVYYPRPLHVQPPYRAYPVDPEGLPVTDRLKDIVVSLPMHPYLESADVDTICAAVRDAVG